MRGIFAFASLVTLFSLFGTGNAFGGGLKGENKKLFARGEAFLSEENYRMALPEFLKILETAPDNANVHYKAGICYLNTPGGREKAIDHLGLAAANTSSKYKDDSFRETRSPEDAMFHLARAYHLAEKIDSAIEWFSRFNAIVAEEATEIKKDVIRHIEMCETAKELMARPVDISIAPLGETVNSPYSDYGPVVSADESTLIFTTRRPAGEDDKLTEDGLFFEDIYVSYRDNENWAVPQSIGAAINTAGHEATIGLSVDGQQLFIYRDDNGDGNIYVSRLNGDVWSAPEKLGPTINSPAQETHAVLTADGNTLYFTSNRPGGLGGKDIYRAKRLPNGEWSLAINLGPVINTPYDEEGPFIHPDGITLYFSSKGHRTMGGYDVFHSVLSEEDQTWSTPKNLGYPINTTDDDVFYVTTPDGKRAYYSSANKQAGMGEKDLFLLTLADAEEKELTVVKGIVKTRYGDAPPEGRIILTDLTSGEVVGTYSPNSKTGKFLFILPEGGNFDLSFEAEGFLFHSQNLYIPDGSSYSEINAAITLEPIIVGEKIVLNNIFFEYNSAVLTPESKTELDKLYRLLDVNENLAVGILGHTDSKGGDDYNLKLSQDRAQSVVDYVVAKGISKERMVAKGFGETQPVARNENEDGSDNADGRALNRRIELKILSTEGELDNLVERINVPEKLKPPPPKK